MRGGGRERRTLRTLKAAAALILIVSVCALIGARLKPAHNRESLLITAAPAASRAAARLAPVLRATGNVNVNQADADGLVAVNGIGPALAELIIAEREANGRFRYPEDLLTIRGIGRATLIKLLPQITLE